MDEEQKREELKRMSAAFPHNAIREISETTGIDRNAVWKIANGLLLKWTPRHDAVHAAAKKWFEDNGIQLLNK